MHPFNVRQAIGPLLHDRRICLSPRAADDDVVSPHIMLRRGTNKQQKELEDIV
jgi:hypothetical protein